MPADATCIVESKRVRLDGPNIEISFARLYSLLLSRRFRYYFSLNCMMRRTCFHRIVGILLIVLALSDVALCEPCEEELNILDTVSVTFSDSSSTSNESIDRDHDNIEYVSPDSSQKSESDGSTCIDCFCCVHVLPSPSFPTNFAVNRVVPNYTTISFFPSSPPGDTFHPPRSA